MLLCKGGERLAMATRPEVHGLSIETVPTYKLLGDVSSHSGSSNIYKEKSGIPILLQLDNLQQLLTSTEGEGQHHQSEWLRSQSDCQLFWDFMRNVIMR